MDMYNPNAVLTKADFVRRYQRGEFGNASPTWDTPEEWDAYAFPGFGFVVDGLYHLRNRVSAGITYYNMTPLDIVMVWRHKVKKQSEWYVSAMAPTALTLFQGEVCQSPQHLWLRYSTLPLTMREALSKKQHHEYGIMAVQLLRRYLCPNSYDWLNYLLSAYPGHVVEFSTYSTNWGTIPGYNTVYWEVRNY